VTPVSPIAEEELTELARHPGGSVIGTDLIQTQKVMCHREDPERSDPFGYPQGRLRDLT